ncbi:uncharacterized protein LOC109824097 [Asparagus officinalis]|uniref:uncharacterized protein LOC109824097 n=1 Tax=Asparagus officinalis TaxID=4686 RepID=UPI00098E8013|nr:uncharacterized protein LOC109824097 [Asparagus officinalis]
MASVPFKPNPARHPFLLSLTPYPNPLPDQKTHIPNADRKLTTKPKLAIFAFRDFEPLSVTRERRRRAPTTLPPPAAVRPQDSSSSSTSLSISGFQAHSSEKSVQLQASKMALFWYFEKTTID